MTHVRPWTIRFAWVALPGFVSSCGTELVPLTASLGGPAAGGRGSVRVVFINNTPHRAVCTFGTYDQTDNISQPDFRQFTPDDSGIGLEGDGVSDIILLTCGRVFSIGGPRLIDLIEQNLPNVTTDVEASIEGVRFFRSATEATAADATAEGGDSTPEVVGRAPPFEASLGLDFPCGSLLVIRFEFDDLRPDEFRTDFELIPGTSSR